MATRKSRSRSRLIRGTNVLLRKTAHAFSVDAAVAFAAVPAWERLSCRVPRQEQTNWCWCATTLGVQKYYVPADKTTQCHGANQILSRADACTSPSAPQVNLPFYLDKALSTFARLRSPTVSNPLPTQQVAQEIHGETPVGARIGWAGGGGHFMAVVGFLPGPVPRVAISDPIYGESDIDYSLYLTAYQGSGRWTHSYLTQ